MSRRVTDPEALRQFMQNHVWLDLVDDLTKNIETLRDELESDAIKNNDGTFRDRTPIDDAFTRGQLNTYRHVIELPEANMSVSLLGMVEEQTEEDQDDGN